MPFDAVPWREPPRRKRVPERVPERVIVFRIRAPDLKAAILDALFDGVLGAADVEALFAEYGLEHE